MNKTFKYVGLLAILPLLTVALTTDYLTDANAIKSKGTSASSYGSANENIVCGDRLCSEYPGGRMAFDEHMEMILDAEENTKEYVESMADSDKYKDRMMHGDKDKMMMHGDKDKMMMHGDKDKMMMHGDKDKMMMHGDKDKMMMHDDDKMMHGDKDKMMHGDKDKMMMHDDDKMMHGDKDKMMMHDDDKMMHSDKNYKDSVLRLARANVPATIPMHMGYHDGDSVYYIITDASDETHANTITEQQGWTVEQAPLLSNAPDSALSKVYFFTNGISGDGIHGYQNQVFTSTPAQEGYSALTSHVHVTWTDESHVRKLTSESEILKAVQNNEVIMTNLPVVINMPQIMWTGGQMMVVNKTLKDDTPYDGGQVLDINISDMEVTFIAHRGWGPDGKTIYYIVTDATPSDPAKAMGVVHTPSSADLITNAAAVDLYQFRNGIKGSGPLGFQPGIATGAPGDANYSPMWRIFVVGWQNPEDAALLETVGDISAYKTKGLIDIGLARPMNSDHIVNCPFIDPFQ